MGEKTKRIFFRLSEGELNLLKELSMVTGLNQSEVLRQGIYVLHTLYKSGLYRFLRPVDEIAKEIIKGSKK
jgi:phage host-nuclease inhibitor protein Gam